LNPKLLKEAKVNPNVLLIKEILIENLSETSMTEIPIDLKLIKTIAQGDKY
jgi:hypothetical protein